MVRIFIATTPPGFRRQLSRTYSSDNGTNCPHAYLEFDHFTPKLVGLTVTNSPPCLPMLVPISDTSNILDCTQIIYMFAAIQTLGYLGVSSRGRGALLLSSSLPGK